MDDFVSEPCEYIDDGCDLFPSCLHCPLAKCRYDQPGKQTGKQLRNREMIRLYTEGTGINELAQRFAVSKRTVYRVIASHREERTLMRKGPLSRQEKGLEGDV